MSKRPSIVTINAGATATLRVKVKQIAGEEETRISSPTSAKNYTIYLHLIDDKGARRWSSKLTDSMWDHKDLVYVVELTSKDTLQMAGATVHFEVSMRDSQNHTIISDLIETPDVLLYINDNAIGRWLESI